MSLRLGLVVVVVALCSCGGPTFDPNEPTTAKDKQLREARASGEIDPPSKKGAAWRYQGDRKDCFFLVGRSCFSTEKAACNVACKSKQSAFNQTRVEPDKQDRRCLSDEGAP